MQLEVTAATSRERLLLRTGHASTKKDDACVPLGTTVCPWGPLGLE